MKNYAREDSPERICFHPQIARFLDWLLLMVCKILTKRHIYDCDGEMYNGVKVRHYAWLMCPVLGKRKPVTPGCRVYISIEKERGLV